jgi:hypothetical protein
MKKYLTISFLYSNQDDAIKDQLGVLPWLVLLPVGGCAVSAFNL